MRPSNHTVRVPADLWDEWQPKLTPEEWSLLCALARKTYGWDKMVEIVSTTQLREMTGLSERRVQRNMASLLKSGVPVEVVCRGKHGTMYRIAGSHSVTGDVARYLHADAGDGIPFPGSDPGDGLQEHGHSRHSDTVDGTHRVNTSIQTLVSPTTKNSSGDGVPVSDEQVAEIPQGTQQVAAQAQAGPRYPEIEEEALVESDGLIESTPTTSNRHPASVSLEGSPTGKENSGVINNLRSCLHYTQPMSASTETSGDKEQRQEAALKAAVPEIPKRPAIANEPARDPEPVAVPAAPVTGVDISAMPADLGWPDQVVWFIAQGEQNLDAIAAAIDQPLDNVKNVIHNHGDIETRRVNGRAHYSVPSAPAPQPAQEPAAAPKVDTASSAPTEAATAPATALAEGEYPDDSDCVF